MKVNAGSMEWKAVVAFGEEQIAKLRTRNDAIQDMEETMRIRCEIAAWKKILRLPEKEQAPQTEADPPY